jgi:2-C-methyl-D-erythritol 2,4-cyclodiphosphate synthase
MGEMSFAIDFRGTGAAPGHLPPWRLATEAARRLPSPPLRRTLCQLRMKYRIGHGYDIHRLQIGGRLVLGGIVVSEEMSPIAHSDGDVVLHAIVDAMLGALCGGDIGQRFPNTDPQYRDAASSSFVERVLREAHQAGWRVGNVDVTILTERPKLSPFREQMHKQLAQLLQCDAVNIKAGTNEGCDAIGRGEAIAAHAVLLLTSDQ